MDFIKRWLTPHACQQSRSSWTIPPSNMLSLLFGPAVVAQLDQMIFVCPLQLTYCVLCFQQWQSKMRKAQCGEVMHTVGDILYCCNMLSNSSLKIADGIRLGMTLLFCSSIDSCFQSEQRLQDYLSGKKLISSIIYFIEYHLDLRMI